MAVTGFGICLIISILVLLWVSLKDRNSIDRYYWTMAMLLPVIILGYWLKARVETAEAASIAFCFIYLDSTLLLTIMIFMMLRSINVKVPPFLKLLLYGAASLHLAMVWGCLHNGMYYKEITVTKTAWGSVTRMTGGPLRIWHYIYIAFLVSVILSILVAGFVRKGSYSRRTLMYYSVITIFGILTYVIEWTADLDFSMLPFVYVLGDIILAVNYSRFHTHDISFLISENERDYGIRGYAAFDTDRLFLSRNEKACEFWPELGNQRVDEMLPEESDLRRVFYSMIDAYEKRGERKDQFHNGSMTIVCEISPFSLNRIDEKQGYLFSIRDATEEQRILDIVTSYNESLNEEVRKKAEDILEIQGKIVAGMANMIENRDNNTGGHVKRTSDIVRIFLDEIRIRGTMDISENFAADIARAAPMHDLGKISIENAILNKPSKLTDEEYTIMKSHAIKSGEIVMILLDGVEEGHFVETAYHVARYHHERWDGRGYPDGLVGSMIPVEARIMAVADVYDALASKRSYKDAMDPALAAKIMYEGMGTQFDPALKPVFKACRGRLEEYYRKANDQS